jgi:hypothetical protein
VQVNIDFFLGNINPSNITCPPSAFQADSGNAKRALARTGRSNDHHNLAFSIPKLMPLTALSFPNAFSRSIV